MKVNVPPHSRTTRKSHCTGRPRENAVNAVNAVSEDSRSIASNFKGPASQNCSLEIACQTESISMQGSPHLLCSLLPACFCGDRVANDNLDAEISSQPSAFWSWDQLLARGSRLRTSMRPWDHSCALCTLFGMRAGHPGRYVSILGRTQARSFAGGSFP